jgi:Phosphate transporter family
MNGDIILVIVIVTALVFDLTNGFHDTANVVATAISTRAIPPKIAVAGASVLNFVGAFISLKVATTVGKGFVDTGAVTTTVVFAGLVGAIAWNIITWSSTGSSGGCGRARPTVASGLARSRQAACSRCRTAPTTPRRPWASSLWRSSRTATSRPPRFMSRPGW